MQCNTNKKCHKQLARRGLSLLELTVAMGLLSIVMLPTISLLATSHKIYNSQNVRHDGDYLRMTALDAAVQRLHGAEKIVQLESDYVEVVFASGVFGVLAFERGDLIWKTSVGSELLARGLSGAKLDVGTAAGATAEAGQVLLVYLGSRGVGEPTETWSSERVWIRPAI